MLCAASSESVAFGTNRLDSRAPRKKRVTILLNFGLLFVLSRIVFSFLILYLIRAPFETILAQLELIRDS